MTWERVREHFRYRANAPFDPAAEFLFASPYVPRDDAFAAFARPAFKPGLPALAAIALATAGVLVMSVKPGGAGQMRRDGRAAAMGLAAGALFGVAAVGFRGGILALPEGGFLIRASTALVIGLALQAGLLGLWMALFDRPAIRACPAVWRASLGAGVLGALASQFWFIGFSLTSAANVRTVALVEVVFAQVLARLLLGQRTTARQLVGMAILLAGVALLLHLQR